MEEYNSIVGARVTFDEPLSLDTEVDSHGFEIIQMQPSTILEPAKIEIVGSSDYGTILEIGDDYMILDSVYDHNRQPGSHPRYTITPDTLQWYSNSPFDTGSGCQIIADDEGVVLAMREANG